MLARRVGIIDAVLAVMRAHVADAGVSEQACRVMEIVCDDHSACCRRSMCPSSLMFCHTSNGQSCACRLQLRFRLLNLLTASDRVPESAIDALAAVLRAHAYNTSVSMAACKAMTNICKRNCTRFDCSLLDCCYLAPDFAGRVGVIEAVLAVMMAHVDNAGVSEAVCSAIGRLCLNGAH